MVSDSTSCGRVDAHQHFWRYAPADYAWMDESMAVLKQDYLPDQLAPVLQRHKMSGCVAVQARPDLSENGFLLALAEAHPMVLGVVGWLDFLAADLDLLLELGNVHPRMKGYRAMVQDAPDPAALLADERFNAGVAAVQRSGKVYELLIHAKELEAAARFCARHDKSPIVLCHLAKPDVRAGDLADWAARMAPLAALPHVACKLSGLITEAPWRAWTPEQLLPYMHAALDLFGPERIIFGSDWPVCLCAGSVDDVYALTAAALASLSENDQTAIWGGNARKIYGL